MTAPGRLGTDFALMRDAATAIDARSAEIRSLLHTFITRIGSVSASAWHGPAATRFREVVERWNGESARLCQALDTIAETIRANERVLAEAAAAHEQRISVVGADVRGA